MSSEEKSSWLVCIVAYEPRENETKLHACMEMAKEKQNKLNALTEEGYQIAEVLQLEPFVCEIRALDPVAIGRKLSNGAMGAFADMFAKGQGK